LPGAHSARQEWNDVAALRPDVVLVALCGFGVERAGRDLDALADADALATLRRAEVWLLDGNAYTSRPGPRVVDGAERIRDALEGHEGPGLRRWKPGCAQASTEGRASRRSRSFSSWSSFWARSPGGWSSRSPFCSSSAGSCSGSCRG